MIFNQLSSKNKIVKYSKNIEITLSQDEVIDVFFNSKTISTSPMLTKCYANVNYGNEVVSIPLFFNGGKQWVFRFSSFDIGTYTFEINSSEKSLNGNKGTLKVLKNKKAKGKLQIANTNKRMISYEDGDLYYPLAFECDWLYALDYKNDNVNKTEKLLEKMQKNGFNQVLLNAYAFDVDWNKSNDLKTKYGAYDFGGKEEMFPFMGSNSNPDYSKLNIDFFKKLDRVIQATHEKGIIAHLMFYVWNKKVNWPQLDSAEDQMYFDYIVKRYQAYPNMIWDISKEALFYRKATEGLILKKIDQLKKLDRFNHLVTVHDTKFCQKNPNAIDFISVQDWSYNLYSKMLSLYQKFEKPVFNIEHGGFEKTDFEVYSGDYNEAEVCLRRNYECLFSGVGSTYYWQGMSWNVLIDNPEDSQLNYKPKISYFKTLKAIVDEYYTANSKPIPWANSSSYAFSNGEGVTLFYVHKENYAVKLRWYLRPEVGKTKLYYWLNPLTGETTKAKVVDKNSLFESPWRYKNDAILISKTL